MKMQRRVKKEFDAEEFVNNLLEEGATNPCDDNTPSFKRKEILPHFYNEPMFKKGQNFYNDNPFALLVFSNILGVIALFAIPSVYKIFNFTGKSSTPMLAYRRYVTTINHTNMWYQSDFNPDSRMWRSLEEVVKIHNFVNKSSDKAGLRKISQKDMALCQFSFMGFAVLRREKIGIYGATKEDWEAFVHVWRVLGYILGIEDRFNICRDSLEETTAVCKVLAERVFIPAVEKRDKEFVDLVTNMLKGLKTVNPLLDTEVFFNLMYNILKADSRSEEVLYVPLTFSQKINFRFILGIIWSLQFKICKFCINQLHWMSFWFTEYFPIMAWFTYGYSNAKIVTVPGKNKTK